MKSSGVPIGSVAPEIDADSITSSPVRLSKLRGRVVLLIFYRGLWCPSCRRQLDQLAVEYDTLRAMRAEIIAISSDQPDLSRVHHVANGWPFPIVGDPELRFIDRYGVRDPADPEGRQIARPSVFLLDPALIVRFAHVGLHRQDRPALGTIMLALETLSGQRDG